ncbi:histone-lysine N-methyltransferase [Aureococcus anophagefferens]|uniref:Histone-lysine N-methyltransferase n=1 Tax=Aureococcus anophagefferens TaxID=44056 RepID=A0ABR1FP15_AURAN
MSDGDDFGGGRGSPRSRGTPVANRSSGRLPPKRKAGAGGDDGDARSRRRRGRDAPAGRHRDGGEALAARRFLDATEAQARWAATTALRTSSSSPWPSSATPSPTAPRELACAAALELALLHVEADARDPAAPGAVAALARSARSAARAPVSGAGARPPRAARGSLAAPAAEPRGRDDDVAPFEDILLSRVEGPRRLLAAAAEGLRAAGGRAIDEDGAATATGPARAVLCAAPSKRKRRGDEPEANDDGPSAAFRDALGGDHAVALLSRAPVSSGDGDDDDLDVDDGGDDENDDGAGGDHGVLADELLAALGAAAGPPATASSTASGGAGPPTTTAATRRSGAAGGPGPAPGRRGPRTTAPRPTRSSGGCCCALAGPGPGARARRARRRRRAAGSRVAALAAAVLGDGGDEATGGDDARDCAARLGARLRRRGLGTVGASEHKANLALFFDGDAAGGDALGDAPGGDVEALVSWALDDDAGAAAEKAPKRKKAPPQLDALASEPGGDRPQSRVAVDAARRGARTGRRRARAGPEPRARCAAARAREGAEAVARQAPRRPDSKLDTEPLCEVLACAVADDGAAARAADFVAGNGPWDDRPAAKSSRHRRAPRGAKVYAALAAHPPAWLGRRSRHSRPLEQLLVLAAALSNGLPGLVDALAKAASSEVQKRAPAARRRWRRARTLELAAALVAGLCGAADALEPPRAVLPEPPPPVKAVEAPEPDAAVHATRRRAATVDQHWYNCATCGLVGDKGCCSACARKCHAGHELSYSRKSSFFCDCGARGDGGDDAPRAWRTRWAAGATHPRGIGAGALASDSAASSRAWVPRSSSCLVVATTLGVHVYDLAVDASTPTHAYVLAYDQHHVRDAVVTPPRHARAALRALVVLDTGRVFAADLEIAPGDDGDDEALLGASSFASAARAGGARRRAALRGGGGAIERPREVYLDLHDALPLPSRLFGGAGAAHALLYSVQAHAALVLSRDGAPAVCRCLVAAARAAAIAAAAVAGDVDAADVFPRDGRDPFGGVVSLATKASKPNPLCRAALRLVEKTCLGESQRALAFAAATLVRVGCDFDGDAAALAVDGARLDRLDGALFAGDEPRRPPLGVARLALTLAERRPAAFEARFGGREGFGFARALDAFAATKSQSSPAAKRDTAGVLVRLACGELFCRCRAAPDDDAPDVARAGWLALLPLLEDGDAADAACERLAACFGDAMADDPAGAARASTDGVDPTAPSPRKVVPMDESKDEDEDLCESKEAPAEDAGPDRVPVSRMTKGGFLVAAVLPLLLDRLRKHVVVACLDGGGAVRTPGDLGCAIARYLATVLDVVARAWATGDAALARVLGARAAAFFAGELRYAACHDAVNKKRRRHARDLRRGDGVEWDGDADGSWFAPGEADDGSPDTLRGDVVVLLLRSLERLCAGAPPAKGERRGRSESQGSDGGSQALSQDERPPKDETTSPAKPPPVDATALRCAADAGRRRRARRARRGRCPRTRAPRPRARARGPRARRRRARSTRPATSA